MAVCSEVLSSLRRGLATGGVSGVIERAISDTLVLFASKDPGDRPQITSFPDILVGDMSQIRGGPLRMDIVAINWGLDVDLWFTEASQKKRNDDKYFESLVDLHKETIN